MADFQQRQYFPVDGSIFAGLIDAYLQQTQQHTQDKTDQHGELGLLVGQAVGELDIHWVRSHFRFPSGPSIAERYRVLPTRAALWLATRDGVWRQERVGLPIITVNCLEEKTWTLD